MHNYYILNRTYESFLKLNPIVEKYGFVFEAYNYQELRSKFDRVITLGKELTDKNDLTHHFFTHPMFDFYITGIRPMVFLRSMEHIGDRAQEKGIDFYEVVQHDSDFVNNLINTLRLHKHGMIESIMRFSYDLRSKQYGDAGYDKMRKSNRVDEYNVEDDDLPTISMLLDEEVKINNLSKLAFDSFSLSYTIDNKPLKYVTLVTALESLFNHSRDQVTHTLSRHLAVLISETKEDFIKNYKSMKKLYGFRSAIVHGSHIKEEEIDTNLLSLEDMVRKALSMTIKLDLSKEELFEQLNAKGFN